MAKAVGLMNPANAAKSSGSSFKEGWVRIIECCYKVHQGKPGEGDPPVPATKWSWTVERLQEGGQEPLTDEHDQTIVEELLFSFGGKSLPFIHPAKADSPDDEEPEDLGTAIGAEGNTVFLVAQDWRPNEKSGLMVLTASLTALQIPAEYLNRCWAPDWVGCVFELHNKEGEKGRDGRSFNYKVATKVLVGPGKGAKTASANGKPANAETFLAPILRAMSEELDGQSLTIKAFLNRVRTSLETSKVDSKLLVPVLSLVRDEKWLKDHGPQYEYSINTTDRTITFGQLPF